MPDLVADGKGSVRAGRCDDILRSGAVFAMGQCACSRRKPHRGNDHNGCPVKGCTDVDRVLLSVILMSFVGQAGLTLRCQSLSVCCCRL